jgi:hypothetical protein
VLLVTTTPASAARPHISGVVRFSPGSLIAEGQLADLEPRPVTVVLKASGEATVVCVRERGHKREEFPAPNHPQVSAIGSQSLKPAMYVHGKVKFWVETNDPTVTPEQAGCVESQHRSGYGYPTKVTAKVVDVSWTSADLTLKDTKTQKKLDARDYSCKTRGDKVKCKQKPSHHEH